MLSASSSTVSSVPSLSFSSGANPFLFQVPQSDSVPAMGPIEEGLAEREWRRQRLNEGTDTLILFRGFVLLSFFSVFGSA